jgi:hypothetical protein
MISNENYNPFNLIAMLSVAGVVLFSSISDRIGHGVFNFHPDHSVENVFSTVYESAIDATSASVPATGYPLLNFYFS